MEDLVVWALVHDAGVFPSGLEQMAHHFAAGNLVQNSLYSPAAPSHSKEADSQMDRIILSDQLYQQIHLHLIHALPMEAVGIVGGLPDGLARLVIEMPNLAGPHEFFADPFAQYQAERRISSEGLKVIAIYQSHPEGGTDLSDADLTAAARWDCAHIVIVPERSPNDADYLPAWRIVEGKSISIPVHREN